MRTIGVCGQAITVEGEATCWSPGAGAQDFWAMFEANAYEPGTVKRMHKLLKPGSLFLDVGAWVGPFSLLALALDAKVVAFEPDPFAFTQLETNLGLNAGDFILFKAAVVPEGTGGSYGLSGADGRGLTRLKRTEGLEGLATISVERVLDLLPEWELGFPADPAFIKVDVEGFELELLPTLGPFLAKRHVPLQVSLHGERFDKKALSGYPTVIWPESNHGDVVALPFATMNPQAWA